MKPYEDERIRLQRLRIINETYLLIMGVVMISMLVKQFYLHAPFKDYLTEFIAFFGASVYILIRLVLSGHQVYSGKKKLTLWLVPLVTSTVITVLSFIGNYRDHMRIQNFSISFFALLVTFVSSFAISFLIIAVVNRLGRKQEAHLAEKFDDSDTDID